MIPRSLLSGLLSALLILTIPVSAQSNDITVELDQFGVGSAFRPGGMVGIRLELTSQLSDPIPVWVQWEKSNADGDIAEYGRSLTLTPGQPTKCWLYAPLSPTASPNDVWSIKIFEEQDGQRGREIGGKRISPSSTQNTQSFDISTSLIGIIGSRRLGLDDYMSPTTRGRSASAHEETRIVSGIRTQNLPDRWFGLQPFEAIVWSTDQSPNVSFDQAEAMREYIMRGGHLIIILPSVGNPWGLGTQGQTPFDDLMPVQVPERLEMIKLSEVLPLISKSDKAITDFELNPVNSFGKVGTGYDPLANNYYEPLATLPDGTIVVIQRTYGHGRITICGLDVSSGSLQSVDLPEADAFWNRILGRRVDTPSTSELTQIQDLKRLSRPISNQNNLGSGNLFVNLIQHEQSATVGILLAFILFVLYWLIAGMGGFYVLKHYGLVKHSWLAYAATAGLFTALAWGAVAAVRPRQVTVKHVTVLDHIARVDSTGSHNPDRRDNDRQYQRAISFCSIFLPNYRNMPISIDSSVGHDIMHSWEPPGVAISKFTNVIQYPVDVGRNLASFRMPSRSTTTRLYLNYLGGVDPDDWGGMLQADPNDPIQVVIDPGGTERTIRGSVISKLPGPLTNITIFWVKNQRTRPRGYFSSGDEEQPFVTPTASGQMLNIGATWRMAGTLNPGERLPVQPPNDPGINLSRSITESYIKRYRASGLGGLGNPNPSAIGEDDRRNYLEMLSLFQQLTPPGYILSSSDTQGDQTSSTFYREIGRELDLSAWFTRPCLIIIGWLKNSELPIPLLADGEPVQSEGLTIVRWIYPLPLREDVAFKDVFND